MSSKKEQPPEDTTPEKESLTPSSPEIEPFSFEKESAPPSQRSAWSKFFFHPARAITFLLLGVFIAIAIFFTDAINDSRSPPTFAPLFATRLNALEQRIKSISTALSEKTNIADFEALQRKIELLEKRNPPNLQAQASQTRLSAPLEKRLAELETDFDVLKNTPLIPQATSAAFPNALSLLLLARARFTQGAPFNDVVALLQKINAPPGIIATLHELSVRNIPTRAALIQSFSKAVHTVDASMKSAEELSPMRSFFEKLLSRIKVSKETPQDAPRRQEVRILLLILNDDLENVQKLTSAYPKPHQETLILFQKQLDARNAARKIFQRVERASLANFLKANE